MVSLREASERLKQHPRYLKGLIDGLGIELRPVGNALAIAEKDIEKLRREIDRRNLTATAD